MTAPGIKLDWIDALKAFAIIGILLNHAVESFGLMPWFSNPSEYWPTFTERMANLFPKDGSFFIRLVQFLGWLGDMGPGVFIFISGLTLTISSWTKTFNTTDFYKSRALRIYPLYITVHLITIVIAVLYFNWKISLFWTPVSLLGLRFTNSLFWFLNPSWWFIWLIIQLYIVFPFLFSLLRKKGPGYFLTVTLIITLLSRTLGILGYTLNANMEAWMTGLFGGTRLFEFAFGMYIGFLMKKQDINLENLLKDRIKLPILSTLIYITGFVASWTYLGSIFSIILITIGLSGIFYSVYEFIIKDHKLLVVPVVWIGKNSFSTFLIHQTFIKYYGSIHTGYSKTIVITVVIIASFISGHYIEKLVNTILPFVQKAYKNIVELLRLKTGLILNISLISGISVLSFFMLSGKVGNSKLMILIYLALFSYLFFYRFLVSPQTNKTYFRYFDFAIIISFAVLLFRGSWLSFFGILIMISFLLLMISFRMKHWPAIFAVFISVTAIIGAFEFYLRNYKPIEIDKWGELPALRIDDATVYSLIPGQLTHLRYNNYNYFVNTNSLGFASPEINLTGKDSNEVRIMISGDAFSMPEGMSYEFSYPALLEKKLVEQFPEKTVHVINAGVTGYGPNEEYAQLKKYIGIIKPDIVINELFINEFQEINLTREERLKDIGLIKGDQKKKNFREKLSETGRLQLMAQTSLFFKNLSDENNEFNYNKSLMFFYEKDSPFYNDSVIMKMNDYLQNMNSLCNEHKCEYIVLGVPGQIEVSDPEFIAYYPGNVNVNDTTRFDLNLPLNIFQNLCKKNNITYLNSGKILKEFPDQPVYFTESWHWNKKGHNTIANYLFDHFKSENKLN